MSGRMLVSLVLLGLACSASPAAAWDGNWTNAESGRGDVIYDPGNTDGKGHTKDPPQKFFIPTPRMFKDVDPDEMGEAVGRDYSPYAMALFPMSVQYGAWRIPKGHYQVKAGDTGDGSPAVHLVVNVQAPPEGKPSGPMFNAFVLKKLGRVIAVLPIEGSAPYVRKKGEKWPKNAVAWVETEDFQPILKFYYRKHVYHTRLNTAP